MNEKTLNVAIIGGGNNGRGHMRVLRGLPGIKITAVVDISEARQTELSEEFPDAAYYGDYREMFDKETPDAVVISTPHNLHYEQTMAAFAKGCHVLLEKPMALKEEHCQEMVKTAREKKLLLQIGFECRKSKLYMRVKDIIDSGEIGELLSISYRHYRGTWMQDWYCDRERAGTGTVIETCHYIDLMRFWSGQDVESVFASSPKANIRKEYSYPDTTYAQLHFSGGLVANCEDSQALSCDVFIPSGQSYGTGEGEWMDPVYGHRFGYAIVGSKGAMHVEMIDKRIVILEPTPPVTGCRSKIVLKRIEDYTKLSMGSLSHDASEQDRLFIEAIRNGDASPSLAPEDALRTHLAVFAIDRSEATGEKVVVSEAVDKKP